VLPLERPRLVGGIPPSLTNTYTELLRPAFLHYRRSDDVAERGRVLGDLLSVPHAWLRQVRGKAKPSGLAAAVSDRAALPGALFSSVPSFAHDDPVSGPAPPTVQVWTDGSAGLHEPARRGTGGCGFIIVDTSQPDVQPISVGAHLGRATNNEAELSAIILALEHFEQQPDLRLHVFSDSRYALGACGANTPRGNRLYIARLRQLIARRQHRPVFEHVAAHQNVGGYNDHVDTLAKGARLLPDDHPLPPTS